MEEDLVGEIRMFGGNFAIKGWAFCDGQEIPVNSARALYSVIGNTFGGVPNQTFKLPNLRDRIPVGTDSAQADKYSLGTTGGQASTYTITNVPEHTHTFNGTVSNPKQKDPTNSYNGTFPDLRLDSTLKYKAGTSEVPSALDEATVLSAGVDTPTPISNKQATVVHNFIICYEGSMP